jgi:putative hemolysin
MLYIEIAIVVVLICVNGLLAMSELAIVSSRPARLKTMVDRNVRGAARALELGANPGKFLSTVQIGITLVGVLSGAFSGATLGDRLSRFLIDLGMSAGVAQPLGVGIVVAVITYGSLIIGELVPKQIALRRLQARWPCWLPSRRLWCGCSTCPAARCCGCSASAARARKRSPTKRSG